MLKSVPVHGEHSYSWIADAVALLIVSTVGICMEVASRLNAVCSPLGFPVSPSMLPLTMTVKIKKITFAHISFPF